MIEPNFHCETSTDVPFKGALKIRRLFELETARFLDFCTASHSKKSTNSGNLVSLPPSD